MYNEYSLFVLQPKLLVIQDIHDDSKGEVFEDCDGVWRLAIMQNAEVWDDDSSTDQPRLPRLMCIWQ